MSDAVRVLLVDDSADLRLVVRRALEAAPVFEIIGEAADGLEALRLAEERRPDLVLLDLAMPTMGGLEALRELRTVAPDAKVVVLSVYEGRHIRSAAKNGGATGYLQKGIPARQFVSELTVLTGLVEAVEGAVDEVERRLDGRPENVAAARRFVADLLARRGFEDTLHRVTLLTSELVTNAFVHAGTPVEIAVRLEPDHVRVDVHDHNPDVIERHAVVDGLEEGGRGLLLVKELASAWGMIPGDEGKTVWFEVPRFDVPATVIR